MTSKDCLLIKTTEIAVAFSKAMSIDREKIDVVDVTEEPDEDAELMQVVDNDNNDKNPVE